ncbi:hypothetical protein DFH29DRAFT_1008610 [Suillus ampliporus]|nr:hypothetical protein DFH29DRAFT_1008610 [Suillus ampliporus]
MTRVGCLLRRSSAFNKAEKDKAEDEAAAARVQAKNSLESYTYSLCNSITNEKLTDKFEPANKLKLESCVNETISAFIATSVFDLTTRKDLYELTGTSTGTAPSTSTSTSTIASTVDGTCFSVVNGIIDGTVNSVIDGTVNGTFANTTRATS